MRTLVIALFLTLPLAATAAAQDRPAPQPPDVNYDFEDHDVDGGRFEHEGTLINWRLRGPRHSLVRPRVHFVPELLKSIERL